MVDFQSRDSRPTYGGGEDEDDDADAEEEASDDPAAAEESDDPETNETVTGNQEIPAAEIAPEDTTGEATTGEADGVEADGVEAGGAEGDGIEAGGAASGVEAPDSVADDAPIAPESESSAIGDPEREALGVAVITVDSDLQVDEDRTGETAIDILEEAGIDVPTREVIAARYDNVQQNLGGLVVRDDVDVIVTLGGDGLGEDDVTVDAARALFDRELPGFGELFRARARESIGTGVLRTRATAGVVDGIPVFCLPGTAGSAKLGLSEIVLPEAPAIVEELQS